MADLIKAAFAALSDFPLVQGAVAILVLVIAALLAWATLRRQLPGSSPPPPALPPPTPPPASIQIESPWLTQHLIEMHFEIERIRDSQALTNSKLDGIAALLKRRANRRNKSR